MSTATPHASIHSLRALVNDDAEFTATFLVEVGDPTCCRSSTRSAPSPA